MPNLFLIAGPNGAGKSTSAPDVLSGPRRVTEFVNADVIAKEQGLSDIAAGRATLERLAELTAQRRDIAFETTLASQMLLPRIRSMQAAGYRFHLIFFWFPSADNTDRPGKRIASRDSDGRVRVWDNELWHKLVAQYVKPEARDEQALPPSEESWTSQDIEDAVNRAVTAALRRHKELGQSVVVWRDGKIVTLKPEEIDV